MVSQLKFYRCHVLRRFLILRVKYVTTGRNERDSDLPALLKVYAVLAADSESIFHFCNFPPSRSDRYNATFNSRR